MKFNWKSGLLAGLVILVVGFVYNWLVGLVFPAVAAEYMNTAIFRAPSDPLMMAFFAYPFVLGVVLSHLWQVTGKKDPMEFAKLYFVTATIPGMFISYTSFQLSLAIVLSWTVGGYIQAWVAAYVFGRVK